MGTEGSKIEKRAISKRLHRTRDQAEQGVLKLAGNREASMFKPAMTVAAVVVIGLAACAPTRHQSLGSKTDLLEIQNRLSEAEKTIDQLSQRVTLMQIIVDSHQRTLHQDFAGDTVTGVINADAAPAPASPVEAEASQAVSQVSPPDAETEEITPAPGTDSSESMSEPREPEAVSSGASPESDLAETAAYSGLETTAPVPEAVASSESSPESQEVESVQRPETEEKVDAEPGPQYQAAMDVLRSGDYEKATGLFEAFARQFPRNDLADNALYWSGECRYTQKDYSGALKQFRQVIEDHPTGSKVPDALLKIGFSYIGLGDKESAITYLKKVVAQYPFSTAGTKAEERLKKLRE
jgi:tol-pal system protein YbgF